MKRLSREERIQQIKHCTLELLGDKPMYSLRSAEIASACGISEAALYKYFHSKEALLDAIIQDYVDGISLLPERHEIPTHEAFRAFLDSYFARLTERRAERRAQLRLMLQISMDRHPLARVKYERVMQGIWSLMEERIRHGQRHWGYRRLDDVGTLVRQLYFGILMMHIEQEVFAVEDYDPWNAETARRQALDAFFSYLLSEPAR